MTNGHHHSRVVSDHIPHRQAVGIPAGEPLAIEPLSPREMDTFRLLAEGFESKAIARELGITFMTARCYVSRILYKLGAANRTQAVSIGYRIGLLHIGDHGQPREMTAEHALVIAQKYLALARELMEG